ncbi:hypothetical protein AB4Z52_29505, partial [Rhizobium sp. 2YAF20]|uniref:hypothetical protein n=1 Tax=Rhizobium sp. 2YAF20 TaxID=3233027 RepID=UPI003F959705
MSKLKAIISRLTKSRAIDVPGFESVAGKQEHRSPPEGLDADGLLSSFRRPGLLRYRLYPPTDAPTVRSRIGGIPNLPGNIKCASCGPFIWMLRSRMLVAAVTGLIAFLPATANARCPLDDAVQLCLASGDSPQDMIAAARTKGWSAEEGGTTRIDDAKPHPGIIVFKRPNGFKFNLFYRQFQGLLSANCVLEFPGAMAVDTDSPPLQCVGEDYDGFERSIRDLNLGEVKRLNKPSR